MYCYLTRVPNRLHSNLYRRPVRSDQGASGLALTLTAVLHGAEEMQQSNAAEIEQSMPKRTTSDLAERSEALSQAQTKQI